jgi:hypothetical protein
VIGHFFFAVHGVAVPKEISFYTALSVNLGQLLIYQANWPNTAPIPSPFEKFN